MEEGDSSGSAARAFTAKKNKKASGSLSDSICGLWVAASGVVSGLSDRDPIETCNRRGECEGEGEA
jgi:hypothetical protein